MNTQKKTTYITIGIAIIVLVGVAVYAFNQFYPHYIAYKEKQNKDRCSVDINALILPDKEKILATNEEITQAMFNQYFTEYTKIPKCPESSITEYNLVSIGEIKETREGHFIAPIVFDLKPVSMKKTEWISPEATTENGWIKNKQGTLSIQETEDGYFLNI